MCNYIYVRLPAFFSPLPDMFEFEARINVPLLTSLPLTERAQVPAPLPPGRIMVP